MNEKIVIKAKYPVIPILMATALLVVIKLAGVIDWSWAWVLSPLWLPPVFFASGLLLIALGIAVANVARIEK